MPKAESVSNPDNDLLRLVEVLRRFRNLSSDMTLAQVMTFLYVAAKPQALQHELWKEFGFADSVISRALAALTDVGLRQKEGLKLIRSDQGEDRRERVLSLTAKGRHLRDDIVRDLGRS